ncbi:MAG: aminotransferase class V-fold PLP-dependent enzyme [Spirochaetales bacterium]|nr:aminotransferase class V-fold PLP-dependent enzyme [Spirochaetales bacterium]
MKRIYLDNAATSFPKAPGVGDVMKSFMEESCTNINRTSGAGEFPIFERLFGLRSAIAGLVGLGTPESVCFSSGVTESLNLVIKGLFSSNDHILVSSCEHNSVMRPLVQMGIPFSRIPCDEEGFIITDRIEELIRPNTRAMVICAAGNVTGAIQDVEKIAQIADKHGLLTFFDAAQAIPYVKFDMDRLNIAGVVFSGHKGLLGPEGTGGAALRKDIALRIPPLVSGGTGSQSDLEDVPITLPDRLEAGTQNLPGLMALAHSVDYVLGHLDRIRGNERLMTGLLFKGLQKIKGIKVVGAGIDRPRTSVISVTSDRKDIAEIAAVLSDKYRIETRVGLHCSPSSHRTMGTFPTGTLRFSPGPFTSENEISTTLKALEETMNA